MNRYLLGAALVLAVFQTLLHIVVGGMLIARPLLESDLADLPRLTLYLCWHGVTIILAAQALAFADGLFLRRRRDSVYIASVLAGLFFALVWITIFLFGVSPLTLPQWAVFGPMALCGALALRGSG